MRRSKKILISAAAVASLAGLAVPAAASVAAAAPAHTAVVQSYRSHRDWKLSGPNTVKLVHAGGTYTYSVSFHQRGDQLSGTLTDLGLPAGSQTLAINGLVNGRDVVFYVSYPPYQGERAFIATIGQHGVVSGNWTETGTEQGNGTFSLGLPARH
jgi:hypothetical protein